MMNAETFLFRDVALPPAPTLLDKLNAIHLTERVDFVRVSLAEAATFLRIYGWQHDTEEEDEARRGVPVWFGLRAGAPLVLGEPGESKELERWVGKLTFTASFAVGTCLGSAWQALAAAFELEMRLHEQLNEDGGEDEDAKLILWLPTALPGGQVNSDATRRLTKEIGLAKELLRAQGVLD